MGSRFKSPSYKLKNNPRYPYIIEDFRQGFSVISSLDCDLVLTPHPEGSGWTPANFASSQNPPMTCANYTEHIRERVDKLQ